MLRKAFLPAVLSLACLLLVTDFAQAQRRGGGRGGWSGGRGGIGIYVGPGYGSGYNSGLYGSGYRSYSPYYGSSYYDPYPSTSYYYDPAPTYVQPAPTYVRPAPVADAAHIRVLLPDGNARVWFDGALTQQTGTDRMFHTPALTAGMNYSYRIRATWMQGNREMTQERVVNVTPGSTSVVNFNQTSGEQIP